MKSNLKPCTKRLALTLVVILGGLLFLTGCNLANETYEGEFFNLNYPEEWYIIEEDEAGILIGSAETEEDSKEIILAVKELELEISESEFREEAEQEFNWMFGEENVEQIDEIELDGNLAFKANASQEDMEGVESNADMAFIYKNNRLYMLAYMSEDEHYNEELSQEVFDLFSIK